MSYDSPVERFDPADCEQINNRSADHLTFSQFNSARSLAQRDPRRSSSLPTDQFQKSVRGGRGEEDWRLTRSSYLMNVYHDDIRRRSTGTNLYRG